MPAITVERAEVNPAIRGVYNRTNVKIKTCRRRRRCYPLHQRPSYQGSEGVIRLEGGSELRVWAVGARGAWRGSEGGRRLGAGGGRAADYHIHSRFDSSLLLVWFTVCPGQPGCPRENRARLPRITGLVHGKHSSFASHILVADGKFAAQRLVSADGKFAAQGLVSMRLVQIVVGLFRGERTETASTVFRLLGP